jgi:hypothetical protein
MVDVVLWVLEDMVDHPVPACRSCGEAHGLSVARSGQDAADLPEYDSCQCCGRELASPGGWPMTVWVRDRRRLMAVCNACRVEYALQAVFTSAPPPGGRVRREREAPRDEPETSPPH